jgi:hypothetical protein
MSLPLRERIVRKAKDKAVENLHEISVGYHKSSPANSSVLSSLNGGQSNTPTANKTTTKRANRSSYKPFAEHNQQSE